MSWLDKATDFQCRLLCRDVRFTWVTHVDLVLVRHVLLPETLSQIESELPVRIFSGLYHNLAWNALQISQLSPSTSEHSSNFYNLNMEFYDSEECVSYSIECITSDVCSSFFAIIADLRGSCNKDTRVFCIFLGASSYSRVSSALYWRSAARHEISVPSGRFW